jgi:CheY-like chemotaxis protein
MPEKASMSGARVLVVEDNEINQQVAQELLEGLGLTVEIANNGKKALEILSKKGEQFDGVLMDLQMPEMDGYQATRLIRQQWSKEVLPVIAMTAHALQSEVQNCLEVGMNDYVSKPVDPDKLKGTLLRWIKPDKESAKEAGAGQAGCMNPADIIPGIDLDTALKRMMGNRSLFDKLLYEFVVNNSDLVERIRASLEKAEKGEAKNLVHTLKGVAGNLSATQVFTVSQQLESALRDEDPPSIEMGLARLETALSPIMRAVMDKSSKGAVSQTTLALRAGLDTRSLGLLIHEMEGLLKRNNLNARRVFSNLKEKLAPLGLTQEVVQMESYLDTLDFKSARRQLSELAHILGVELNP